MSDLKKYRGNQKIYIETYNLYKDKVEERVIIDFLKSIPIEKLKQLVNLKINNPFDKTIDLTEKERDYRERLANELSVQVDVEIMI